MRVFKGKWFNRWAHDEAIHDSALWAAAQEIITGQVEADLGKCLYKKRIAKQGKGKRGGYRLIVAYRRPNSDRIFFVDAFSKNEKANLSVKEIEALSKAALAYIEASDLLIDTLEDQGKIFEISEGLRYE